MHDKISLKMIQSSFVNIHCLCSDFFCNLCFLGLLFFVLFQLFLNLVVCWFHSANIFCSDFFGRFLLKNVFLICFWVEHSDFRQLDLRMICHLIQFFQLGFLISFCLMDSCVLYFQTVCDADCFLIGWLIFYLIVLLLLDDNL